MYARKILKAVETLEQQRGTGIQQGQNFNIIHYFFFLSPKVLAQCSLTVSWWANFPIRISMYGPFWVVGAVGKKISPKNTT